MFIAQFYKKTPLVFIAIFYISGLLLGTSGLPIIVPFILMLTGVILLFLKKDVLFTVGIILGLCSYGWQIMLSSMNEQNELVQLTNNLHERTINFRGEVLDFKNTEKGKKYRLHLFHYNNIEVWLYNSNKIPCTIGDTLSGTGEFQKISSVRNPGEYDFRNYNHRKGIYGWIFPEKHAIIIVNKNDHWNFRKFVYDFREKIRFQLKHYAPGTTSGLLNALILGDKTDVDEAVRESFAETGVIHVLAVSGLHVGYVLIALLLLKNIFRLPWGWDRTVILIGLILFVIITGGKASVIRASIMAGLFAIAPVLNRNSNIWNIIGTSAFVILVWHPMDVFDLSFQLSFLAVISIVFFYNWFENVLPDNWKVSKVQNRSIRFFWGLFLVSFAAQIGTVPLTSFIFGKIPIVSLIANMLIVPLIGLLVGIGFFLLFLGWIPGFGFALGNTAWLLTKIITFLTKFFAGLPFAAIHTTFNYFQILLYLLLVISIILIFIKGREKYGVVLLLILCNLITWNWAWTPKKMDIIFLDVGQGDAAIVRLPDEKVILIDAGQRNKYDDMGADVVLPVLKYLGIQKLDWVVMSHPHNDHIGGIVTVMNEITIDTLWDTYISYSSWTYKRIVENAKLQNIVLIRPKQNETRKLSKNVYVQFLAPDSTFAVQEYNVNNSSIVFKLIYGKTSILFTGDLEYEGDVFLLPFDNLLKSDVLKVAHHGSSTSTTEALLTKIAPKLAVISVGWKNKFAHPSPVVIQRLQDNNVDIHRTDIDGALWLQSDGNEMQVKKWR